MRVPPARRRRWNNILIILVIVFIGLLNLPTIIKTYLIEPQSHQQPQYPHVLNPAKSLKEMNFAHYTLVKKSQHWHSDKILPITADQLVEHWLELSGTVIDEKTFHSIEDTLGNPGTVEVWYDDQEEPQRITYYQGQKFWVFKTWQDRWVAISVDKNYIIPTLTKSVSF